jgi:hypothetical protein
MAAPWCRRVRIRWVHVFSAISSAFSGVLRVSYEVPALAATHSRGISAKEQFAGLPVCQIERGQGIFERFFVASLERTIDPSCRFQTFGVNVGVILSAPRQGTAILVGGLMHGLADSLRPLFNIEPCRALHLHGRSRLRRWSVEFKANLPALLVVVVLDEGLLFFWNRPPLGTVKTARNPF